MGVPKSGPCRLGQRSCWWVGIRWKLVLWAIRWDVLYCSDVSADYQAEAEASGFSLAFSRGNLIKQAFRRN